MVISFPPVQPARRGFRREGCLVRSSADHSLTGAVFSGTFSASGSGARFSRRRFFDLQAWGCGEDRPMEEFVEEGVFW